jgi:ribosomal protein RSM22 (predicted rRNA methylase)
MQLPLELQEAIETEIESSGLKSLISARENLTERYRGPRDKGPLITDDRERLSYLLTRMPATYAANRAVFKAIKEQAPDLEIKSVLDLGAGPGTAMWAACDEFSSIKQVTLIENDRSLASFGQRLAKNCSNEAIAKANWLIQDLELLPDLTPYDLVIFSYSIGELQPDIMAKLLIKSWQAAKQLLVIVEPGTPSGFERIRLLRTQLIEMGAHLIAPCPSHNVCPMSGGDWCHFPARVERTSLHRKLKGGTLGYEDEKYSYVSATKTAYPFPVGRVVREPQRRSGHVLLPLCMAEGLNQVTVSKRTSEDYRIARKLEWGDALNLSKQAE